MKTFGKNTVVLASVIYWPLAALFIRAAFVSFSVLDPIILILITLAYIRYGLLYQTIVKVSSQELILIPVSPFKKNRKLSVKRENIQRIKFDYSEGIQAIDDLPPASRSPYAIVIFINDQAHEFLITWDTSELLKYLLENNYNVELSAHDRHLIS